VIRGEDALRTRYAGDKALRQKLMAIYGEGCPLPEAYTELARAFMRIHGLDAARFRQLAAKLFENYTRTARRESHYTAPRADAFRDVTELFRAVDCANPVVDFTGALLLGNDRATIAVGASRPVSVRGVGLGRTAGDGPAHAQEIAAYHRLATVGRDACAHAGVDFAAEFRAGRALLEAYTCFPVAPLGFLLASGIAPDVRAIDSVLDEREITVTGGMNLGRAAWNNPALNALIVMCDRLAHGDAALGAVHGNGGLGYRQGLAILSR
jgi:hypothetical protein